MMKQSNKSHTHGHKCNFQRDLLLDVLVYKPYTIYISFAKSTGATPGFQVLISLLKLLRDTNFFKV